MLRGSHIHCSRTSRGLQFTQALRETPSSIVIPRSLSSTLLEIHEAPTKGLHVPSGATKKSTRAALRPGPLTPRGPQGPVVHPGTSRTWAALKGLAQITEDGNMGYGPSFSQGTPWDPMNIIYLGRSGPTILKAAPFKTSWPYNFIAENKDLARFSWWRASLKNMASPMKDFCLKGSSIQALNLLRFQSGTATRPVWGRLAEQVRLFYFCCSSKRSVRIPYHRVSPAGNLI